MLQKRQVKIIMDAKLEQKAAEVIQKIQNDPELQKEFTAAPAKTIEKLAGINIPDFMEPMIEKVIREQLAKGADAADPMELVRKFLK